ncbi:MAG: DUF2974 domain-containing protein [Eubacteriales bacterium]|nr:DUF2974 domain-containing protein [Eubacteriales bacterium]
MANILDYLEWRGDLALAVSPFNEVDALLLAELSFINFEGIVPPPEIGRGVRLHDAAKAYFSRNEGKEIDMGVLVPDRIPAMFCAMAASRRFGDMLVNAFEEHTDSELEQQFAAVTVDLGDGTVYVSFRGTDDTLVGWKEDLNMGFLAEVPSQEQAVRYLNRVARQYAGRKLRVGGHSKGGNLAVYSAVRSVAAVQDRILAVYNNDGPGFMYDLSATAEHQRIAGRIYTIVPQSSVVGMLMQHEKNVQVVYSTYEGIMQHDGFSWEVKGTQFVHLDDFSREGKIVDETIDSWASELSARQREALADAIYEVLTATGAQTLSELNEEKLKSAVGMLKSYKNLDRETRRALAGAVKLLLRLGTKNMIEGAQTGSEREIEHIRRKLEEQKQKLLEKKK